MTGRIVALAAQWRESPTARWLFQDRGPERRLVLHHRRIFVLPTGAGLAFIGTLAVLLVASTNYQLSLGYLLTFLIAAASWAGLHMTFANLSGLALTAVRAAPVFAGETAAFEVEVADTRGRARYSIRIRDAVHESVLHVGGGATRRALIQQVTARRGRLEAPRATLETTFPLGLWRGWSYWQPDAHCVVYPAPEPDPPALPVESGGRDDGFGGPGDDAVAALRPYASGDAPRLIAWKAYARSGGETLASKLLEGASGGDLRLDYAALPAALGVEGRIARLAAWVLRAHAAGVAYALRIDGESIGPACGDGHRDACLTRLAFAVGR